MNECDVCDGSGVDPDTLEECHLCEGAGFFGEDGFPIDYDDGEEEL